MIYLDNNATTPIDPVVSEKLAWFAKNHFGNPSSLYPIGLEVKEMINTAREDIADVLGAARSEIIFTGSGTESDNFALRGIFDASQEKKILIISAIEHPAVIETANYLEKQGIKVIYIPVDEFGMINLEFLENAVTPETGLISIMHANNELGTIQPVKSVVKIAKQHGIPVHTDAVQSFGKIPFNVHDLGIDLLSISAHKVYGPKGIGALYIRKGTKIDPLIYGGNQERLMRAGTENTIGIIGLASAVKIIKERGNQDKEHIDRLADKLKNGIEKFIPKVKFNGHPKERIKGTVNISFIGLEAEAVLLALATKEIYVSTGSACSEGSEEVSHVMSAIGLKPETARSSIRMSVGRFNTDEDIDTVLKKLPEIITKLREITAMDF